MSAPQLEVIWDATKAHSNIAKHGVTFAQAATVLLDPLAVTVFDAAHSEHEERWFTLGLSSEGKLLAVAHTYSEHRSRPSAGADCFSAPGHASRTRAVRERTPIGESYESATDPKRRYAG